MKPTVDEIIKTRLKESIAVKSAALSDENLIGLVSEVADKMAAVLSQGGKVLLCGNGGSASDALHIAGEIVGRFRKERRAWPAVALNADVATMTSIANDYGFDEVYARQVEAHMTEADLLIGFSTSGNSKNVHRAILKAKEIRGATVLFSGSSGGKICGSADFSILVPSETTARIQECHITIGHILCEIVEERLAELEWE